MTEFVCCCVQDAKPLEVYSIEFMVDNGQLGFLGNTKTLSSASHIQKLHHKHLTKL